ncbi:MAG TPA: hypothetical protein PKV92_05995 [Thermodesulfovibrio thiophilus]|uniref:hypothetical protein n=1 Tax=Thermodesulfovibrio thiophilus TaxID=340095 RepID=UPI00040C5D54|nr:hypothetical protein [Thermodesulfovibrio thiophilus]HHW20791.1 hypothetical protein [Thermodesulfovibrio thiophilus]HQD36634.1 hypothetical protein [Thermodesulfovibrio thiophilus]
MTAEDRIDPLGQYRGIRSLREGSVFAKYKIKKKFKKKEESNEESSSSEEKTSEHRIDIEA